MFFADPSLDIIDMIKTGKDQFGRQLTNELNDWYVNDLNVAYQVATRVYAPSFFGISNIMNAGSIDKYGRQRNALEETRSFLTGVRTFRIYPEVILEKHMNQLDMAAAACEGQLNTFIMEHPEATDKEIDKQVEVLQKQYNNYERKVAEAASIDFDKLGPPPK